MRPPKGVRDIGNIANCVFESHLSRLIRQTAVRIEHTSRRIIPHGDGDGGGGCVELVVLQKIQDTNMG